MKILHFEDLGDTSVISECSLGVNLVFDNFFYDFGICLEIHPKIPQKAEICYLMKASGC